MYVKKKKKKKKKNLTLRITFSNKLLLLLKEN